MLPEIEITNTIKLAACVVALLAAYLSSSDWLKKLLSRLSPFKADPVQSNTVKVDEAVRILLQDSQTRSCSTSVRLLNEWIAKRNLHSFPAEKPVT